MRKRSKPPIVPASVKTLDLTTAPGELVSGGKNTVFIGSGGSIHCKPGDVIHFTTGTGTSTSATWMGNDGTYYQAFSPYSGSVPFGTPTTMKPLPPKPKPVKEDGIGEMYYQLPPGRTRKDVEKALEWLDLLDAAREQLDESN